MVALSLYSDEFKQLAALFWVLASCFLLFLFCPVFKGCVYHSRQYRVSLCQKSSSWCLANSKRHWLKKTFENAETKLLDYIFFLIPVLKYTLLYFSSSHTQTNTAPCNNKQYWTDSLLTFAVCLGSVRELMWKQINSFFDQWMMNNRYYNKNRSGKDKIHFLCDIHFWLCQTKS